VAVSAPGRERSAPGRGLAPGAGGRVSSPIRLRAALSLLPPACLLALARRPDLWASATRLGIAVVVPALRRPGDLDAYLHLRTQSMFAPGETPRLTPEQLVDYLAWCGAMATAARNARRSAHPAR
jgi:hypothetical protein